MKNRLIYAVLAIFVFVFGYSCSDDDYLKDYEIQQMIDNSLNGQWQIVNVNVKNTDWQWTENQSEGFYSAKLNLPELTENIFDEGAVIGYYKFNINSKTALPYAKTFIGDDGLPFTETYSCDFTLGSPSTVTFYLEASDAGKYNGYPPAADFQIILIW